MRSPMINTYNRIDNFYRTMKTILYIGGFELPDKNAAAQRVISNAKLLRAIGYDVMLIGLTKDASLAGKVFIFEGFRCVNLSYPHSPKQWCQYLFTLTWYKKYIEDVKPEVIIAYNHPAKALRKLVDYDRKRGGITLSDCTEWYEPNGNVFFKLIKGWDINQRMYKVHPMLDGIIAKTRIVLI